MSIAPPLHKAVRKNQKATPPPVPEKPEGPAYTPPKPSPNVVQTAKAAVEKPKGLARMPRKPLPPLIRVENPRRLRKGSKEHRKLGGLVIASPAWGSPFRPREVDGQWFVAWIGDEMQLGRFKPDGWEDIPYETRLEAAQLALEAFRDWIASPASSGLLDDARAILRGYNLICFCPPDWPCHGDVLLELANQ